MKEFYACAAEEKCFGEKAGPLNGLFEFMNLEKKTEGSTPH